MASEEPIKFVPLDKGEKSRTYYFPKGEFTVRDVTEICVRPSGSHRLNTKDGRKFIVAAGWLAIEIAADVWSV